MSTTTKLGTLAVSESVTVTSSQVEGGATAVASLGGEVTVRAFSADVIATSLPPPEASELRCLEASVYGSSTGAPYEPPPPHRVLTAAEVAALEHALFSAPRRRCPSPDAGAERVATPRVTAAKASAGTVGKVGGHGARPGAGMFGAVRLLKGGSAWGTDDALGPSPYPPKWAPPSYPVGTWGRIGSDPSGPREGERAPPLPPLVLGTLTRDWPASPLVPIGAWPSAEDGRRVRHAHFPTPVMDDIERIQGVAHDAAHWYFATTTAILKYPLTADLTGPDTQPLARVGLAPLQSWGPESSLLNHFNDLDVHDGHVYVTVTDNNQGRSGQYRSPAVLALLDARTLRLVAVYPFPDKVGSAAPKVVSSAWVAVQPRTGLIYTSAFALETVDVYELTGTPRRLVLRATILPRRLIRVAGSGPAEVRGAIPRLTAVQGGAFSKSGKLYLSLDAAATEDWNGATVTVAGGLYGFDVTDGAVRQYRVYARSRQGDEAEGLTVRDLRRWVPPSFGKDLGVLHLTSRRGGSSGYTDLWHYGFANPDDADLL